MRVHIRYFTPDEKEETRYERNIRFGQEELNQELEIPDEGLYLWEMYWSISRRLVRAKDFNAIPISPTEFISWCKASGTLVYPNEYDILCAMDDEFCSEMNKELQAYQQRIISKGTEKNG